MVVTSARRKYGSSSRRLRTSFRGRKKKGKRSGGGSYKKKRSRRNPPSPPSYISNTVDACCNTSEPASPFVRRQTVDGWTNTSRPSSPLMHRHTAEASCSTNEPRIRVYVSSSQGETEVNPADLELMLSQGVSKQYQLLKVVCDAEEYPADSSTGGEEEDLGVYRTFATQIKSGNDLALNMFEMIEVEINNLNYITKFDKLPKIILDTIRMRVANNQEVPSFEYKFRFHRDKLYFVGTSNEFMNFESSHDMRYRCFGSTSRRTYRSINGFTPAEEKVFNELNRVPSYREIIIDPLNPHMSIALYSYNPSFSPLPHVPVGGIELNELFIRDAMGSSSLPIFRPSLDSALPLPPHTLSPSAGTYFSSFRPPSTSSGSGSTSGSSWFSSFIS